MKSNFLIALLVLTAGAAPLFCAGAAEPVLVNTETISLDRIDSVTIAYSSDSITLLSGPGSSLVVNEYMSRDNRDFYAVTTAGGTGVTVEQGRRPRGVFRSRVEITIPRSYTGSLAVSSQSGSLRADDLKGFSSLTLETSSGSIKTGSLAAETITVRASSGSIGTGSLAAEIITVRASSGTIGTGNLTAETIAVRTSSGSIRCDEASGNIQAGSESGSIHLDSVKGAVSASASSGSLRCSMEEVRGDISLESGSGSVRLTLPRNTAFRFSAESSSGSISVPFADSLTSPFNNDGRRAGRGLVNGAREDGISVDLSTSSGSITVEWQ